VESRLRGPEGQGIRRHTGGVGHQDVDATLQRCRQRIEQVALEDTIRADVAAGTRHRCRVDIGGIQVDTRQPGSDRCTDSAGSAAEVENHGIRCGPRRGPLDREGVLARHEDSGIHKDAQAAELHPAEDVLERNSRDPPVDQFSQSGGGACGFDEERGFVFREVTPLVASGEFVFDETVIDGVENAFEAWQGLMRGDNIGKMLVCVAAGA